MKKLEFYEQLSVIIQNSDVIESTLKKKQMYN